jgi:hypothetical protein
MSEFVKKMIAMDTRERKIIPNPIKQYVSQLPAEFSPDYGVYSIGYEITASYKRRIFCDPADLPQMIKNAKRVIKEYIYGDFQHLVLELERTVYAGEFDQARALIKDILWELYDLD